MRKLTAIIIWILCSATSFCQDRHYLDSLYAALAVQKEDSNRVKLLYRIGRSLLFTKPDSAFWYGSNCFNLAKKTGYKSGEEMGLMLMGTSDFVKGNYYRAIRYGIRRHRIFEETNDLAGLSDSYNLFYSFYRDMGDHDAALRSILRSKSIKDSLGTTDYNTYANLGNAYERLNRLDSALVYLNKAYEMDFINGKGVYSWIIYELGLTHAKLKHYDVALAYYRMALEQSLKKNITKDVIDCYNGIADLYKAMNIPDSVIHYSNAAQVYFGEVQYGRGYLHTTSNLAAAYKQTGQGDSALKYLEWSSHLKDSIYGQEKVMQAQNLKFNEQERQQELDAKKAKEKQDRESTLQYVLTAIGLITFLVLLFLLTRSIIVGTTIIRVLGVVALLLVFEFVNLLLHPVLVKITGNSPLLMLVIMVAIAALLVPTHHKLEKWTVGRLVEKNKKIRLSAARRTIEQLEEKGAEQ